ncbi:hypothetical protein DVB37_18945 [Achromobacter sp. B7]|nr:hypothetical protein DVB37_18945 [Achromobacter sp. B7]
MLEALHFMLMARLASKPVAMFLHVPRHCHPVGYGGDYVTAQQPDNNVSGKRRLFDFLCIGICPARGAILGHVGAGAPAKSLQR